MLKGTLPVATLKMCCDILTELDNEATFTFNEGITINLSDASNVALASIDVGLQAFENIMGVNYGYPGELSRAVASVADADPDAANQLLSLAPFGSTARILSQPFTEND